MTIGDETGKSGRIEPSFNMNEWMKEVFPDGFNTGMDRAGASRPSNNNSNQQNIAIKLEENYQVASPMTNIRPSSYLGSNHVSDRSNYQVQLNMASTLPMTSREFAHGQASYNGASQLQQHQQLHPILEQVPGRSNVHRLSVESNTYRNQGQQLPVQVSASGTLQQQTSRGTFMLKHPEPFNVPSHIGQAVSEKNLQQFSQLNKNKPLVTQSGLIQASAPHQSQNLNLANQLPGKHQQTMLLGPSSQGITPQVRITNAAGWVDEAMQKIVWLKQMYLPDLLKRYKRAQDVLNQATTNEVLKARCIKVIGSAESVFKFLQMSESDLMRSSKEQIYNYMTGIVKFLEQSRARSSFHAQQAQQAEASGSPFRTPHLQHGNSLPFNTTSTSLPMSLLQQGATQSFHVGSSAGVQSLHHSVAVANTSAAQQQKVASWRDGFNPTGPLKNTQQDTVMKEQMNKSVQRFVGHKNKQHLSQKPNENTTPVHVGVNKRYLPLPSGSSSLNVASPQNSQQSSSQLERNDYSPRFSKSTMPSLSASPSAFTSPLTPSSRIADSEKSPFPLEQSSQVPKNSAAHVHLPSQDINTEQSVTDTQVSQEVPLLIESTCPGDNQSSQAQGDSVKHLIEVVKSISSESLTSCLKDIVGITNVTDRMTGRSPHDDFPTLIIQDWADFWNYEIDLTERVAERSLYEASPRLVIQDLADDIRNYKNGNLSLVEETSTEFRMKRQLEIMASTTEMESCTKRQKKEPNGMLLEEIKEINQKLIEVVVDVMNTKDVSRTGSNEGTFVRCSYNPVVLTGNMKLPNTMTQMYPNLPLELFVSADYPNSSPTVLESMPPSCSESEEEKDIWMTAKANFSSSICRLEQPISLIEMAKTWDRSAREAFNELAQRRGGGDFSSRYGKWENCVVAI